MVMRGVTGLVSDKTKLNLTDAKGGTKRVQARLYDLMAGGFQKLTDDAQSLKTRKVGRRRKDATDANGVLGYIESNAGAMTLDAGVPRAGIASFDAGTEIGMLLRNAREQSEQDLTDISNLLRIRLVYLQAIEDGKFKTLPGMTYAIGYVRSYAKYLDLDVDYAIALFKSEAQEFDLPRQLVFPSPAPEGKFPGGAIMIAAALLVVGAYIGWYQMSNSGVVVSDSTLETLEALQSGLNQKSDVRLSSDGFTADQQSSRLMKNNNTSTARVSVSEPEPAVVVTPEVTTSGSLAPVVVVATAQMRVGASEVVAETRVQSVALKVGVSPEATSGGVTTATIPDVPALVSAAPSNTPLSLPALSPFVPIVGASPKAPADVSADLTQMVASAMPAAQIPVRMASILAAPAKQPRGEPQDQAGSPERSDSLIPSQSAEQFGAPPGLPEQRRVIIHANADSWVQVRLAGSTTIMTRVMRAGDSYQVPARGGLRLFTGNAGALTIEVDGKSLPKLGGLGQIVRDVDLDPDNLKLRGN
jgi:cytoskeleton protein RodZ